MTHTFAKCVRMAKSRRIKSAGHVTYIGADNNFYDILVVRPEGIRPFRRLGIGGMILEWILNK
jgi:hypothetical protein